MTLQSPKSSSVLALAGLSLLAMVMFVSPQIVGSVTREDGFFENLTAIFFAAGMFASLYAIFKHRLILLGAVWAILCLFFLGEEVSWFQRVFDYSVPLFEQNSTQSEFNLHNLNFLNTNRVLQPDGSMDLSPLSILMSSQNLFRIGFGTWFLIVPILSLIPFFKNLGSRFGYVRPTTYFLFSVWFVVAVSFVLTVTTEPPVKDYVTEVREVFYALVIFIYTLSLAIRPDAQTSR